jgi:hypothetical protein
MAEGKARTHTLTSNHSYGRAIDIVAAGGGRHSASARANQIAFRRWVTSYRTTIGDSFRVLGKVDRTWDWAHVELPSATIGFRTIEEAITRGRACLAPRAIVPCNFPPHLPAYLTHSLVT